MQQGAFSTDEKIKNYVRKNFKDLDKKLSAKLCEKIKDTVQYTVAEQKVLAIDFEKMPPEKFEALTNGILDYLNDFDAKYDEKTLNQLYLISNKVEVALTGRETLRPESVQEQLMVAISNGDLKDVEALLSVVPNALFIDRFHQSPLELALSAKQYDVIDLLVEKGEVSLKDEKTAQQTFASLLSSRHPQNGFNVQRLNHLMDLGLNVNVSVEGMTPLKHFIKYGTRRGYWISWS